MQSAQRGDIIDTVWTPSGHDPKEDAAIAHPRRFFVDFVPEAGQRFTISGEEAHHMLGVVRIRRGEEIALLDGSGVLARARLCEAKRNEAVIEVLSREMVDVEPSRPLTVQSALPRSTRMDVLVEKCCELGVHRLVPMVTERSVVDPMTRQKSHLQRWNRIVVETLKQCGRTRLMEITPVVPFEAALGAGDVNAAKLIASTYEGALPLTEVADGLPENAPVTVMIGPEGDFTPEEVERARAEGYIPVSLGKRILRVETAGIAMAAYLLLGR